MAHCLIQAVIVLHSSKVKTKNLQKYFLEDIIFKEHRWKKVRILNRRAKINFRKTTFELSSQRT